MREGVPGKWAQNSTWSTQRRTQGAVGAAIGTRQTSTARQRQIGSLVQLGALAMCHSAASETYVWRPTIELTAVAVRGIAAAGRRVSLPPVPAAAAVPAPAFRRTSDEDGRGSGAGCRELWLEAKLSPRSNRSRTESRRACCVHWRVRARRGRDYTTDRTPGPMPKGHAYRPILLQRKRRLRTFREPSSGAGFELPG